MHRSGTWNLVMFARPTTDDEASAAQSIPEHSFESVYRRELAQQTRRATLLVGDPQVARELVHDVFADLYERWDEIDEPGPYLNVAVVNRCRDHARRTQRRERLDATLAPSEEADDEVLWDALQQLPFNHRAVLVLRFYHQMTEREIADALGCRPGSVGPWLQRGLAKLRKDLS